MEKSKIVEPDNTAVRTALWRALHVQVDTKPHILEDEIGLKLIAPPGRHSLLHLCDIISGQILAERRLINLLSNNPILD